MPAAYSSRGARCSTPSPNTAQEVDVADQVQPTGVREAGLQRRPHAAVGRAVGEPRDRRLEPVAAVLRDEHRDQHAHQRPGDDGQAQALGAHHHRQAAQREQLVHQPQLLILRRRLGREVARHLGPLRRREAGERSLARDPLVLLVEGLERPARAQPPAARRAAVHHDLRLGQLPRRRAALRTGGRRAACRTPAAVRSAGAMRRERLGRARRQIVLRRHGAPQRRQGRSPPSSMPSTGQRSGARHRSPGAMRRRRRGPRRRPAPPRRGAGARPARRRWRRAAPGARAPGRSRGSPWRRRRPDRGARRRSPLRQTGSPDRRASAPRGSTARTPRAAARGDPKPRRRARARPRDRASGTTSSISIRSVPPKRPARPEDQGHQLQHVGRRRILAEQQLRPGERRASAGRAARGSGGQRQQPRRQRRARQQLAVDCGGRHVRRPPAAAATRRRPSSPGGTPPSDVARVYAARASVARADRLPGVARRRPPPPPAPSPAARRARDPGARLPPDRRSPESRARGA